MEQTDPQLQEQREKIEGFSKALAEAAGIDLHRLGRHISILQNAEYPVVPDSGFQRYEGATGLVASINCAEILATLGQIQGRLARTRIPKSGEDTFLRRTYSNIGDVMDALAPHLDVEGVTLLQLPTFQGTHQVLRAYKKGQGHEVHEVTVARYAMATLIWKGGEYCGNVMVADCESTEPKAVGSLVTYLRRYGAVDLFNLTSEDDDGDQATPGEGRKQKPPRTGARRQERQTPTHPGEEGLKRGQDELWTSLVKAADGDENLAKDILLEISRDDQGLGVRSVYQIKTVRGIELATKALEESKWT